MSPGVAAILAHVMGVQTVVDLSAIDGVAKLLGNSTPSVLFRGRADTFMSQVAAAFSLAMEAPTVPVAVTATRVTILDYFANAPQSRVKASLRQGQLAANRMQSSESEEVKHSGNRMATEPLSHRAGSLRGKEKATVQGSMDVAYGTSRHPSGTGTDRSQIDSAVQNAQQPEARYERSNARATSSNDSEYAPRNSTPSAWERGNGGSDSEPTPNPSAPHPEMRAAIDQAATYCQYAQSGDKSAESKARSAGRKHPS